MAEWSRKLSHEIARAYGSRDLGEFVRLLKENPHQLRYKDGTDYWMSSAACDGELPFIRALVELGIDVNEPEKPPENEFYEPEGAIQMAATFGHLEAVRWFLEHGARINFEVDGQRRCRPLISAATSGHLDIVKLLVEHGADIHGTYNGVNAITQATTYGKRDVHDYLYSLGARELRETTPPDHETAHREIVEYFTERCYFSARRGPLGEWSRTLPVDPPVVVHVIPAREQRTLQTIFTVGLGDRPLPAGGDRFAATELRFSLSPEWPVDDTSLADSRWGWPFAWLERIVIELRSSGRWPDSPALFPATPTTEPLGEGTTMCAWIAMQQPEEGVILPDHRTIDIQTLFPIYAEERELAEREGEEALLERFEETESPPFIVPGRENVAV